MSLLLAQISGGGSITGTLAATESQDTSAFAGVRGHTGTLTATEAQDSASLTGKVGHTGTLAATEVQDVAAFSGKHGQTGTLDATEAQDVAAFAGVGETTTETPQAGAGSNKHKRIHPRYIYDEPEVTPEVVEVSKRTYKEKPKQIKIADVWNLDEAIAKLETIVADDFEDDDVEALLILGVL